ncbi:uncharacterized protein Dana_GF15284 [Drosophila ananassae]|uniref:Peptidase M13 N-terminal domain-containing protein n=1 Tax=Drosophila ananassae TaxID=7217 RepID=B3MPJ9_DROAN|nr:uncharacterized protein Dana_GF15284 [Drosophila ananassae]
MPWMPACKDGFFVATQQKIVPKFLEMFQKLGNNSYPSDNLEDKVAKFYNLCRNNGNVTFLDVVQPDVNVPWPYNTTEGGDWPKERFQWLRTLAKLRRYGMKNALFRLNLKWDAGSSVYRVVIKKQQFESPSDYIQLDKRDLIDMGFDYNRAESLDYDIDELQDEIKDLVGETEDSVPQLLSLRELKSKHGVSLSSYLEIVFGHPFPFSFQVEVEDLDYLAKIFKLINGKDQEVVALYLMDRFVFSMHKSARLEGRWEQKSLCTKILRTSMEFASNLLFEKHVLGENKLKEFQIQMDRLFAAVRKQFNLRLDRSSLNVSFTSSLRRNLNSLSINIGNMPKDQDHERFVTDFYSDLRVTNDDKFAKFHVKALEFRERNLLKRLNNPTSPYPHPEDPESSLEVGSVVKGNVIIVPYNVLLEPYFMANSHDVFKMSMQGFFLASLVEKALFPEEVKGYNCQKYDQFLSIFDDQRLLTNRSSCQHDDYFKTLKELVFLNLVHEAFFSQGSGYSLAQPEFTKMSLEQLFFLNFVQTIFNNNVYWEIEGVANNPLLQLTSFSRAFNIPSSA